MSPIRVCDRGSAMTQEPVPMILHCPSCSYRHVDKGDFASKPHHTHACQACGEVWRPAIGPTVGVRFLPGFKDVDPFDVDEAMAVRFLEGLERGMLDGRRPFNADDIALTMKGLRAALNLT